MAGTGECVVHTRAPREGGEQYTVERIARDWDAFRYDVETGNKILPKPPMLVATAEAVEFDNRIPK